MGCVFTRIETLSEEEKEGKSGLTVGLYSKEGEAEEEGDSEGRSRTQEIGVEEVGVDEDEDEVGVDEDEVGIKEFGNQFELRTIVEKGT